ncbi:hypothetical protein [Candidatus Uabimicrobium amorphum]|uniref:Uncharacterized protein n=1 Tax=Uabimicrobium amorphum TaxID=2596890 RepID=A0A5S9ILU4_UABAM|nr:hypothetical protein [Candidatus Uabimicrobium amorphum]BBM84263.1 hypothetical protein UABAM_02620 [Candidatus Uabimicrobium amorphum]
MYKTTIILTFCLIMLVGNVWADRNVSPGAYAKAWKDAKEKYEDLTGEKKPELTSKKKSSGITKAAKAADKAYDGMEGNVNKKSYKKYESAIKKLRKKTKAYLKVLEKAKKELDDKDKEKAVDVLIAYVKAIAATAKGNLATKKSALKKHDAKTLAVTNAKDLLKATVKKADIFIADIEAAKTIDEKIAAFNKDVHTISRDMGMQLNTLKKFGKEKFKKEAGELFKISGRWGSNSPSLIDVKDDATDNEKLEAFNEEYDIFAPMHKDIYKFSKKLK